MIKIKFSLNISTSIHEVHLNTLAFIFHRQQNDTFFQFDFYIFSYWHSNIGTYYKNSDNKNNIFSFFSFFSWFSFTDVYFKNKSDRVLILSPQQVCEIRAKRHISKIWLNLKWKLANYLILWTWEVEVCT